MNERQFTECTCGDLRAPTHVDILAVRAASIEEHRRRLTRLIGAVGDACERSLDRADWVTEKDRTVARLPQGGRAEVFHASGALSVKVGLPTMAALFEKVEPREELQKRVEATAARLRLASWLGPRDALDFERLWQIKAAAADRQQRAIEPVLCRAIGAWRQSIGTLPVWGGASVTVRIAADGALDGVAMQLLEAHPEVLERAAIIEPAEASRAVYRQLESLLGTAKVAVCDRAIRSEPLRLGYLHLGRRKSQRLLAPHYVASVRLEGEDPQAYQIVVPATSRSFQPLCLTGQQAPAPALRRAA